MDFNPILDGLKATYQLELALFIAEEPLRKFATGLPGDVLTEENRRGKFMKFHSTHWALMKDLATEADVINVAEEGYTRKLRGITYGALVLPLRDPAGEPLGLLAVAKDFSASRAASGRSLVWQSLLALFAIVTLAVAIIVVIRGFLLRPIQMINERFQSLAEGDRSQPIDQPETLCQEMRDLAESYERLRTIRRGKKMMAKSGIALRLRWLLAFSSRCPRSTGFAEPAPSLPLAGGLPVVVRTGPALRADPTIDENEGSCTATVDLRLRWMDARLAYPKEDGAAFQNFKDAAAEARMAEMWVPRVELANTIGSPDVSHYLAADLSRWPGRIDAAHEHKVHDHRSIHNVFRSTNKSSPPKSSCAATIRIGSCSIITRTT